MYLLVNNLFNIEDVNFIGAFLYGSQNYMLDTADSDKDVIILLTENDKSHKEIRTSSGIVKIYTLKYFLSCLKNGDMECYEILYTKHRIINIKYEKVFDSFVVDFTKVLNIDRIKWSLGKKLFEHLSNVTWIPFNKDNSKYHRKRVYWSYRVFDQLTRIINGESFNTTFVYNLLKRDRLMKIKTIPNYLALKELNNDLEEMYGIFSILPKNYIKPNEKEDDCLSYFYNTINSFFE